MHVQQDSWEDTVLHDSAFRANSGPLRCLTRKGTKASNHQSFTPLRTNKGHLVTCWQILPMATLSWINLTLTLTKVSVSITHIGNLWLNLKIFRSDWVFCRIWAGLNWGCIEFRLKYSHSLNNFPNLSASHSWGREILFWHCNSWWELLAKSVTGDLHLFWVQMDKYRAGRTQDDAQLCGMFMSELMQVLRLWLPAFRINWNPEKSRSCFTFLRHT